MSLTYHCGYLMSKLLRSIAYTVAFTAVVSYRRWATGSIGIPGVVCTRPWKSLAPLVSPFIVLYDPSTDDIFFLVLPGFVRVSARMFLGSRPTTSDFVYGCDMYSDQEVLFLSWTSRSILPAMEWNDHGKRTAL